MISRANKSIGKQANWTESNGHNYLHATLFEKPIDSSLKKILKKSTTNKKRLNFWWPRDIGYPKTLWLFKRAFVAKSIITLTRKSS